MRIGVMTGGGDCAGLNAVIWSAVRTGRIEFGDEVLGLEDGFDALILRHDAVELTLNAVDGILPRGGTMLGTTNRGNPFEYVMPGESEARDYSDLVVHRARSMGLEGLVVIGGDGTMRIAHGLARKGLPIVGVPKTIDNDLKATDYTFGFDTAVNIATEALDRLRTTAESHERVMILEVMGRNAGWIALESGIAGAAHAVLIPEIPYDPLILVQAIRKTFMRRKFYLIVVAEGAAPVGGVQSVREGAQAGRAARLGGAGEVVADLIRAHIDPEIRVTVLGHIQRGGSPTAFDRTLAVRFGREAVHALHDGLSSHMVALRGTRVVRVTLDEAVGGERKVDVDGQLVQAARSVGLSFGDRVPAR
jgi:6-phosphofructokinase 1